MFLLFILLLIPLNGYADNPCQDLSNEGCSATAGCYFENVCTQCTKSHYCPAGELNRKKCSDLGDGTFTLSDIGATEEEDCYKMLGCDNNGTLVNNCKYYYREYQSGIPAVYCGGDDDPNAHIEDNSCYMNERDCSAFDTNSCTGTKTGKATYLPEPDMQKWSVQNCKCKEQNVNDTTKHCIATKNYTASGTVANVGGTINYTLSNYYCTGCIGGHYVTPDDITPQQYCQAPSGNIKVCKCTPVNQGYYMSSCSFGYPLSSQPSSCVTPTPCPAGQTTDGTGATSLTECHFTGETQFCDAGGCFTLDEIQGTYYINPSEWTPAN